MNQNERIEKIEEYGRGFDLLAAALAKIPPEAWDFRPAPGEWSIHEVILHMADSESIGALRLRKMIAEPGSTLMTYDEAKWAVALNYGNQSMEDALQIFKLTREMNYRLLKTLPNQVFMQSAVHPEYVEPYTFENWLATYTRHVSEHLGQLEKIYRARKKQNK